MAFSSLFFSPFRLDLVNSLLWQGEHVVPLRPKPLAVLRCLIERRGQVVSREEIFRTVWAGTVVNPEGLKVYIREIRRALNDDAKTPQFIETVPGRGYRFIAPLTATQPVASRNGAGVGFQLATENGQLTTPLVGRKTELAQLQDWLEHARKGTRQIVFVTGEPGIGKTTLVNAFLGSLVSDPSVWVAYGQCVEHFGAGEPYLPVLEALERLCLKPGREGLLCGSPSSLPSSVTMSGLRSSVSC